MPPKFSALGAALVTSCTQPQVAGHASPQTPFMAQYVPIVTPRESSYGYLAMFAMFQV